MLSYNSYSSMGRESIWADIDHAESCLVSAMYNEAVEVASSALRTLRKEARDDIHRGPSVQNGLSKEGAECAELVSMVEAAGMVLLQARNHMGWSNVFEDLISIFDSVGKVPYSLILTGTCLQLSVGFHPSTQMALEEYLRVWRSTESSADGLMVKVAQASLEKKLNDQGSTEVNDTKESSCWFYLPRTDYLQLTEIYALEVLAKVHKNSGAADLWIKNSNITEEDKQTILEKLQLLSESQNSSLSCSTKQSTDKIWETSPCSISEPVQETGEEMAKVGSFKREATESIGSSLAVHATSMAPEESKSRAVVKESGIWRFPFMRTILRLVELLIIRMSGTSSSNWTLKHCKLPQSNVLVAGPLMTVIVYALFQKRQHLIRYMMEMVNLARVCFSDLWQLAFSVHLNPLAAVQPLSSGF